MPASRHPLLRLAPVLPLLAAAPALRAQEPADLPAVEAPLPPPDGLPAITDTPPPAAAGHNPAPSTNATINLINALVKKGILSAAEAAELIAQAEADAAAAQQQQAAVAAATALPPIPPPLEDDVSVSYVPQVVRNQIRDEIQQELLAQAREEQWGKSAAPDWTSRITPFLDFRGRYEGIFFGDDNLVSETGDLNTLTNFNAINNGSPYDASDDNPNNPPLFNLDEDRERARIRVRAGADILLGEGFNAGVRLATGESSSPVSPNQSLGAGGGNFSKYAVWLDRAFLSYDAGPRDGEQELVFLLGRFESPFIASEVQWDDDIGFDGLAARGKVKINDNLSTFFSGGAFPIYNTDYNFSSTDIDKAASNDKWLYGAQAGIQWKISDDLSARFAVSYYDFQNVRGELSSPYTPLSSADPGSTDHTRTLFSQHGNTYMPLRNIDNSTAANQFGDTLQYQYYGLASEFRNLAFNARLDYEGIQNLKFSLSGEVIKNIAFDESDVIERAYSGGRAGRTLLTPGEFEGGDTAWNLAFQFGRPALAKFGDWSGAIGYRYVESDAVIDGFTDSDFGGGGTNVRGFTLGGTMAITPAVRAGIRWMSSDEVDGPPLSTDTLQFDLNAKF